MQVVIARFKLPKAAVSVELTNLSLSQGGPPWRLEVPILNVSTHMTKKVFTGVLENDALKQLLTALRHSPVVVIGSTAHDNQDGLYIFRAQQAWHTLQCSVRDKLIERLGPTLALKAVPTPQVLYGPKAHMARRGLCLDSLDLITVPDA